MENLKLIDKLEVLSKDDRVFEVIFYEFDGYYNFDNGFVKNKERYEYKLYLNERKLYIIKCSKYDLRKQYYYHLNSNDFAHSLILKFFRLRNK